MEFADVTVKESPGLCRCCLSEGCYKDLGTEYAWMNDTEVYADMLLDCFDIGITQHNDGPNGPKRLICEVCITRLRDACNFKKQVVDSEKKFIDMLGRGEFRHLEKQTVMLPIYTSVAPMKAETIEEVTLNEDYDDSHVEFLDDNDFTEDEELVKSEGPSNPVPVASTSAVKRGRPKKTDSEVPEKKPKVKGKSKMPKGANRPEPVASGEREFTCIKRNRLVKLNTIALLQYSTILPFKWHRQNYLCFYCNTPLNTFDALKEHNEAEHKNINVRTIGVLIKKDDKVKVDVASIKCRLCDTKPEDIEELIFHLKRHGIYFYEVVGFGIIPYKHKSDSCQCAVCGESFQYYIKLNQHMNKHYGQHVCEICGKSFLSTRRLKIHSLTHGSGFPCNRCPETFHSYSKRKNHYEKAHGIPKFHKCSYCPETFPNYGARTLHYRYSHDVDTPIFNCPVCGKTFRLCSKMQYHLNTVHAKA